MVKLRIIKSKAFTANDEEHTHYTCAYKGRVFGVSTLRFSGEGEGTIKVDGNVLTIGCDVEVLKNTVADQLTGEVRQFLDVVPKVDLNLGDF